MARLYLTTPVVAAVTIACYATQSTAGGDAAFDAVPPPEPVPEAGDAASCPPNAAITWTALYADFFGPTGIAQCGRAGVGTTTCHHDGTGDGAIASNFICGETQESCYQAAIGTGTIPKPLAVAGQPDTSYFITILRQDNIGAMPFAPNTVVFSVCDMARIRGWITAGALDN